SVNGDFRGSGNAKLYTASRNLDHGNPNVPTDNDLFLRPAAEHEHGYSSLNNLVPELALRQLRRSAESERCPRVATPDNARRSRHFVSGSPSVHVGGPSRSSARTGR